MGNECPQKIQIKCERRLTRMETTLGQHGELLTHISTKIDGLRMSNGTQTTEIAVLKTEMQAEGNRLARKWGLIAGAAAALLAGVGQTVLKMALGL